MESVDYRIAFDGTKDHFCGKKNYRYDKIYYSSNEELGTLFSTVEMKGRRVLTVQASSDQLFHISKKKPSSIDTFDINQLTKYYYYLRKWSILYGNSFYFNVFDPEKTYELLRRVKVGSDEEIDAYSYWREYLRCIPIPFYKDFFMVACKPYRNEIKDLRDLRKFLVDYKLNFSCIDISRETLRKKYDTIVISNILEYYDADRSRIDDIRNNLYGMLSDGGEILSSNIMDRFASFNITDSFGELFDTRSIVDKEKRNIGYVYTKKGVNKK